MSNDPTRSTELQAPEKRPLPEERTRPGAVFQPDVDILENGDAYLVYADLPGVDEKRVQVRLEKGILRLDAEIATGPDEGWNPLHLEYRSGAFHREFRLSEEIDTDAVSASMRDGVLELRLPKAAHRQARTIAVQAG